MSPKATYAASEALPPSFVRTLSAPDIRAAAASRGYELRSAGTRSAQEEFLKLQAEDERFEGEDLDKLDKEYASGRQQTIAEAQRRPAGVVSYGGEQLPIGVQRDDRALPQAPFGDGSQNSHDEVEEAVPADEIEGDATSHRDDLQETDEDLDGDGEGGAPA